MKPILFNTEMVRAILEGRKTTTRRVVKPQPNSDAICQYADGLDLGWCHVDNGNEEDWIKAPYIPGDVLYVREAWAQPFLPESDEIHYRADYSESDTVIRDGPYADTLKVSDVKWRPSIHMPKEAARLFLRVTDVRVERLFDSFFKPGATIFDLSAEGITIPKVCANCIDTYGCTCRSDEDEESSECGNLTDARYDFSTLWDSTVKPADRDRYGWKANPWVWVIEFERCEKP